ncbi:IPT/TIG domain-containing protein [Streptomyces sp. NPDC048434]|uniref:IPT/TIG domain-containing protein n=1 Tax=Streptomyces sp. NPDC048434 TaxID=3365549 RepID=UPI0037206A46
MNRSAQSPTASAAQQAAAVPAVISVSPPSGSSAGGNTVTVTGTGFTNATAVRFGATPAPSFTVNSDTQITATTPLGTGTVQVTVTTPSGISNQFVTYAYVATPAPGLSSVSPASGPSAGGMPVTLTGSGFSGATVVRFGAVSASFVVNSGTQITATAPAGSGTVQVTVTGPGGTSNGVSFSYTAVSVPVLTSVNPASGPSVGGTTVTLTGTGLATVGAVRFGSVVATSFTVVSDTHITAIAPAGTGTVQVTVTGPGGTSNGVFYTYSVTPTLSGVTPNQGPTSGGNTVMLTGANLTGANAVSFGATPATSFTVVSSTQISVVVPAATPGPVDVTVTTPGGTTTLQSSYFYVSTPVLTGIAPPSGPLSGGNTVTLAGVHLVEATAVRFGTTAATAFTVVSDTQITAVIPAGAAGSVDVTVSTAGGTGTGVSYTYLAAPVVTTVVPNQGPTAGGITLTLTGTRLAQATTVLLGAALAGFTVVSDSHIVVDALPGAAGPVDVTVTTPGGTSAPKTYTRVAPPGI